MEREIRREIKRKQFYTALPLTSPDEKHLLEEILDQKSVDFIEWRRDYFTKDLNFETEQRLLKKMRALIKNQGLIYTYRSSKEGGVNLGKESLRLQAILAAIDSEAVDYIDIELESEARFAKKIIKKLEEKNKTGLILSHHNFKETPQNLGMIFKQMEIMGADVFKLAVLVKTKENLRELIRESLCYSKHSKVSLIVIAMGKLGGITRVIPELLGGSLSYVGGKEATAPGQLKLQEIFDLRERLV